MGAIGEFERSLIKERQREGILLAKERGVYKGRQKKLSPEQVRAIKEKLKTMKKTDIAREFNISRQCLYNYIHSL